MTNQTDTTKIILRDLRLSCLIGVDAPERRVRQTLLLDADITLAAVHADDSSPTLDYREATEKLRHLAAESQFGLMETFAAKAAALLQQEAAANRVRVYCRKPKPFSDLAEAGVEVCLP